MAKVHNIDKGSIAFKQKIAVGDQITHINGNKISDVLDYKFYAYDENITLTINRDGKIFDLAIRKDEGEDLGIDFENYLMDKKKSCSNKCIFCFIDQNPRGMRKTIYFKDDDARLSFLLGNYISLTNLSETDVERIIKMRLAPINISVHTTNPKLRDMMLGHKKGGESLEIIKKFSDAGLKLNTQIVVCQDVNDGEELKRTLNDLKKLNVSSISVVPAGITNHRERLFKLEPISLENANNIIDMVEQFGKECIEEKGTSLAFCSDEFYIRAKRELPHDSYYEDMEQLENGVGMISLFKSQFEMGLRHDMFEGESQSFTIATGSAAYPFLSELISKLKEKDPKVTGEVIEIKNNFYGNTVSVAGLITGSDLLEGLKDKKLNSKILITENMLRDGGDVFLDDFTIKDLEEKLGRPIKTVENDGVALLEEIYS